MGPWLLLLLLLSLDCRATATVSSMNLASGMRDAATRGRVLRSCCGISGKQDEVPSRPPNRKHLDPPTPGLRSIGMPYLRNKLAVIVTDVHGTGLEV